MTRRAEYLKEIERLLRGASDEVVEHVFRELKAATDPAVHKGRFVGIGDLREYADEHWFASEAIITGLWRYLLTAGNLCDIRHADTLLPCAEEEPRVRTEPDKWVMGVDALRAFARTFIHLEGEHPPPGEAPYLPQEQKTLLLGWAASL